MLDRSRPIQRRLPAPPAVIVLVLLTPSSVGTPVPCLSARHAAARALSRTDARIRTEPAAALRTRTRFLHGDSRADDHPAAGTAPAGTDYARVTPPLGGSFLESTPGSILKSAEASWVSMFRKRCNVCKHSDSRLHAEESP